MEGRVVAHLLRERAQQVPDALLLLHVYLEVSHHHDPALGADALLAATELAGGHVALHDIDAVLLVEGDSRNLIEAHDVVLADQPALAVRHVDEHLGERGLAAREEVGVGRDLLVDMALTGSARAELDQVVVSLHERNHAQQDDPLRALIERLGLQADGADQEVAPLLGRQGLPPASQDVQHIGLRHLDRAQRTDPERAPLLLLGDERVVLQRDLGVEAIGEHPFVGLDEGVHHADVVQVQARKLGDVAVVPRVEPGAHDVDQLDGAILAGPRLEHLLVAGADRSALELLLDDGETFLDLPLVDTGAVAAEQELHHVGRHRILAGIAAHQILAHQVAGKGLRGDGV
jgi:hypothetical protein